MPNDEEVALLRTVLHQNAESIFLARQRAERELELAKEALEARTAELATALAMMQATLEATADGILATDPEGRVTALNGKLREMWSLTDAVLATRDHLALLGEMAPQVVEQSAFLDVVHRILLAQPAESFDVLALADGRVFERYTRTQTVEDRVVGRVWSYRDVTERVRALVQLGEAKSQAEAASRTKSAFLAMISHELRTPLNAIAGYSQILELGIHGGLTEPQRHALVRIQASQRHLLTLIDELLMHTKLETGTTEYHIERVAVVTVLANAEALIAPQAWAKQLTLVVDPPRAELGVRADPEKLQQILANLLSNAVKFTPPGGRIVLACASDPHHVRFEVRDTGVGIPDDQRQAIFEPFVQVRSELTRTAHGTGLGLAISRALARGMGGTLEVESELGRGSVFTLSLPTA